MWASELIAELDDTADKKVQKHGKSSGNSTFLFQSLSHCRVQRQTFINEADPSVLQMDYWARFGRKALKSPHCAMNTDGSKYCPGLHQCIPHCSQAFAVTCPDIKGFLKRCTSSDPGIMGFFTWTCHRGLYQKLNSSCSVLGSVHPFPSSGFAASTCDSSLYWWELVA